MAELFILGLADIFSVYPEIFNNLLYKEREKHKNENISKKSSIHLPSDPEWQEKVYYRLLYVQKKINSLIESGLKPEDFNEKVDKPKWDPMRILKEISPTSTPTTTSDENRRRIRKRCVPDHPIEYIDINVLGTWSLQNISRAAKLLRKPPLPVKFDDEHEMRKVYSLIYDVFRYKHVLSQTLCDVSFYAYYPQLRDDENRVWLMLFELYGRHFLKRHSEEAEEQERLYKEAEVDYISKCLWIHRVRLAAAIARLRIKNGALLLSQLLPIHLQNEKVAIAAANPVVTGWMNPFKLKNKNVAVEALKNMGMTEVHESEDEDEKPLKPNQYKWDKVCPLFMSCLPNDRCRFAQSDLVRNYYFVMQDRTFSIAPAVLSRLLDHFDLDGDIVQTHVSSPRSTAYLAALFHSVNRVKDFLAFGAGQNLPEYKDYIKMLGINNIRLYAENFCSLPLDTPILGTVVGIFATPPNSFSGVADPIDLICSRGGDLSMLAVLTESQISEDGKKRVTQLLEEQRDTLRLAMSRPQVQFILYETHSIVGSENQDMVASAVEDINRYAFEKHLENYKEKKRLQELQAANNPSNTLGQSSNRIKRSGTDMSDKKLEESNIKQNLLNANRSNSQDSNVSVEEDYSKYVKVPKTDEFLVSNVPDICINQDKCLNFGSLGCFVSLIHRKEVTKLDAKYLIKMAESRGLFGTAEKRKMAKTKVIRKLEKKIEAKKDTHKRVKFKKDDLPLLIERLNQPTHASLIRSNLQSFSSVEGKCVTFDYARKACLRHDKYNQTYPFSKSNSCVLNGHSKGTTRAKMWWKDTIKYVQNLNGVRKHQDQEEEQKKKKRNGFIRETKNGLYSKISERKFLPPLRLPRTCNELHNKNHQEHRPTHISILLEKKPFPVTINQIEFKGNGISQCKYNSERIYNPILNGSLCQVCKRPRNSSSLICNNELDKQN